MSRRVRYLRVAFSTVSAAVCLLVIVLWVRSYCTPLVKEVLVTKSYRYTVCSADGALSLHWFQRIFIGAELMLFDEVVDPASLQTYGFRIHRYSTGAIYAISIAYWLLTVAISGVTAAPWLHWRFSLRTLLIATTLVALGLGLILWWH